MHVVKTTTICYDSIPRAIRTRVLGRRIMMKRNVFSIGMFLFSVVIAAASVLPLRGDEVPALKGLIVSGGCCHDYPNQDQIVSKRLSERVRIEFDIVRASGTSRKTRLQFYEKENWAEGYDVVIHNECFGGITDVKYVERIAKAHFDGVPGIMIHCSAHSYRHAATDEWRKCMGVSSFSHEKHRPVTVNVLESKHPIMKGFPSAWKTPNGELYKIEKLWPQAVPLAKAYGEDTKKDHVVIWTNTYGSGRIFATTLGHHNETIEHEVYMNMMARGVLWACDKLDKNGDPLAAYVVEPKKERKK